MSEHFFSRVGKKPDGLKDLNLNHIRHDDIYGLDPDTYDQVYIENLKTADSLSGGNGAVLVNPGEGRSSLYVIPATSEALHALVAENPLVVGGNGVGAFGGGGQTGEELYGEFDEFVTSITGPST